MALCIKHCIMAKLGISITLMRLPIYQVFTLLFTLLTFTQIKRQMVFNNVCICLLWERCIRDEGACNYS